MRRVVLGCVGIQSPSLGFWGSAWTPLGLEPKLEGRALLRERENVSAAPLSAGVRLLPLALGALIWPLETLG